MLKRLLVSALTLLFLASCGDLVQVVYTAPIDNSIKKEKGFYVYENDDVRIVYSFWHDNGIMSFSLYNKLNKPIYIDWKKSSFVNKQQRFPYYSNSTKHDFVVTSDAWATVFANYGYTTGIKNVSGASLRVNESHSFHRNPTL